MRASLHAPRPPATSESLSQECRSAEQALEDGNNLRPCATLARFATVGVFMESWHVAAICRAGRPMQIANVTSVSSTHAACIVCTLVDHSTIIGRGVTMLEHKALSPRDGRHVHFV
jgi:hypothetical protein